MVRYSFLQYSQTRLASITEKLQNLTELVENSADESIREANERVKQEYVDSDEVKITDYFDIDQNSWSNDGVSDALDRAVKICRQL